MSVRSAVFAMGLLSSVVAVASCSSTVPEDSTDESARVDELTADGTKPPKCKTGFAECNGILGKDRCETNLRTDTSNCGACGNLCMLDHTTSVGCVSGVCQAVVCETGWGDCDGNPSNGCETDLTSSASNCGSCNNVCVFPNATASCSANGCEFGACNAGYRDCDSNTQNGCEQDIRSDSAHCGSCTTVCAIDEVCIDAICVPAN